MVLPFFRELGYYRFFAIMGCTLMVLGWCFYVAPSHGSSIEIVEREITVSDCGAGQNCDVVFRVENHSGRPIRILGIGLC